MVPGDIIEPLDQVTGPVLKAALPTDSSSHEKAIPLIV